MGASTDCSAAERHTLWPLDHTRLVTDLAVRQRVIALEHGAEYEITTPDDIVGAARNVVRGQCPLNGLRHPRTSTTSGWYLWAGTDLPTEADFFEPIHASRLVDRCPDVLPFLGLAPGWRFLLGENGYVDIWFDGSLLSVDLGERYRAREGRSSRSTQQAA